MDAEDSAPTSGRVRLALDWTVLSATAASDDDPKATERLRRMTLQSTLVYSPTDRLNLVLRVPLVHNDWSLDGPTGQESQRNLGLGDLQLGARYFAVQDSDFVHLRRQELALSAGSSLPTGPDDLQANGERLDDHAQLGTGALGAYAGLIYAFHQDPWNLSASLVGQLHTVNGFGYHYGSSILAGVTAGIRPWERASFELGMKGRYAWRDTAGGDIQNNTGGMVLSLAPGARVNLWDSLWLHAEAELPVATALNGQQTVGPTVVVGLRYAFQ